MTERGASTPPKTRTRDNDGWPSRSILCHSADVCCALFRGELPDCYFASYLIRVRTDAARLLPGFLNEYARTERGRSFLSGRAIRTADGKFNINTGTLKRVLVPLPDIDEQAKMVSHVDRLERKLAIHRRKHSALTSLFRTLLHQLLTAQLRVSDLDVETLLSQAVPEPNAAQP